MKSKLSDSAKDRLIVAMQKPAPCDTCPHKAGLCTRPSKRACQQFMQFINRGKWSVRASRVPTERRYHAIYPTSGEEYQMGAGGNW